jgi:hypothetical protein
VVSLNIWQDYIHELFSLVQFLISKAQQFRSWPVHLLHNSDLDTKLPVGKNLLRVSYVPELYAHLQHWRQHVSMTAAWAGVLLCSALVGHLSMCGWCWRCWQPPWNIAAFKQHLTISHPTEGARATSSGINTFYSHSEHSMLCCWFNCAIRSANCQPSVEAVTFLLHVYGEVRGTWLCCNR